MTFTVLTLFPDLVRPYFSESIMAKAVERGLVNHRIVNIRDFATDRHRTCDDAPYGGGYGMVMKAEPVAAAIESVARPGQRVVFATPSGALFDQAKARELAQIDDLVLICGRYEGIDQRVIDRYVDDQLSIGDYVLSSGEIASLVIIDAVYRLLDGVISAGSLEEESHENGLLEYPHYTRPEVFQGVSVPPVLLSGHHREIAAWRRWKQVERTMSVRPDLFERAGLNSAEVEELKAKYGGQDGPDQSN
jgi:tRNA (guanine37-N1)-methyltransferase